MAQPKFKSSPRHDTAGNETCPLGYAQDEAKRRAVEVAIFYGDRHPFIAGVPATGQRLAEMTSLCRQAGLAVDWPTLRSRAASLNKALPGYVAHPVGGPEESFAYGTSPERLRAWAYAYAGDLIDPAAEQSAEALTTWKWW